LREFDAPNEAEKRANSASAHAILGHSLGGNEIAIGAAALWLDVNRDSVKGNPLLELMSRFELSVLDAVAASKVAHALRYRSADR
jgi:hypothetical protein